MTKEFINGKSKVSKCNVKNLHELLRIIFRIEEVEGYINIWKKKEFDRDQFVPLGELDIINNLELRLWVIKNSMNLSARVVYFLSVDQTNNVFEQVKTIYHKLMNSTYKCYKKQF